MKVKDLIEQLKNVDPELECYVYSDHGQQTTKCDCVGIEKVFISDKNEYYVDLVHPGDIQDDEEYIDVCVISD